MKINKNEIKKNAPLILTVVTVAGIAGTAVLGVRACMKAEAILRDHPEAISLKDKARITWKAYILVIGSAVLSGTCAVLSHKLSASQIAALSGVIATSSATLHQYREEIRKVLGVEEEKKIYEKVRDDVKLVNVITEPHSFSTDGEVRLWKEGYSGQYFYATDLDVLSALFTLNKNFSMDLYAKFNDWLDLIPLGKDGKPQVAHYLDPTDEIEGDGELIGWSYENNAEMGWEPADWIDTHTLEVWDDTFGCNVYTICFEILPSRSALVDYGYSY